MHPLTRALCLLVLTAIGAPGFAQTGLSKAETRKALLGGDYATLDRSFGDVQRAYANGKISDEALRDAFRVFYDTDRMLQEPYEKWVNHSPKSYVAHLAKGIYFKRAGMERRGAALARETSEEQWAAMRAAHAIAAKEFNASLKLDRKPLLTYLHFIDVELYSGRDAERQELLAKALAIDPKTFIIREKYLGTLRPRWGGSMEKMRAFVEEARAAGLTSRQMANLHAIVQGEEAWKLEQRGDLDAAANAYQIASLLNPETSCASCGPEHSRAYIFVSQKQYAKAIETVNQILRKHPDDPRALYLRGYCHFGLKKGPEAQADLLRSAQLGDTSAQTLLAKLFLDGGLISGDRGEAIRWLEKASKAGDKEAAELLPYARNPSSVIKIK